MLLRFKFTSMHPTFWCEWLCIVLWLSEVVILSPGWVRLGSVWVPSQVPFSLDGALFHQLPWVLACLENCLQLEAALNRRLRFCFLHYWLAVHDWLTWMAKPSAPAFRQGHVSGVIYFPELLWIQADTAVQLDHILVFFPFSYLLLFWITLSPQSMKESPP